MTLSIYITDGVNITPTIIIYKEGKIHNLTVTEKSFIKKHFFIKSLRIWGILIIEFSITFSPFKLSYKTGTAIWRMDAFFFNSKGLQLRNHNIKVLIKLVNQRKKFRLSINISMQNIFMDFWIWLNKGNVTLTENVQFLTKHAHHLNETLSVWSECIKVNSNVIIQCKPIKYKLKRCANATNKTFTKI